MSCVQSVVIQGGFHLRHEQRSGSSTLYVRIGPAQPLVNLLQVTPSCTVASSTLEAYGAGQDHV